jgi:hypothetical protein
MEATTMQRQDEITVSLDTVAAHQRRNIWRDRVVAALFAVGLAIGLVAMESAATHANAAAAATTQPAPVRVAMN